MDNSKDTSNSLTLAHKILIFFGGIFIVLFAGFQYFEKLPGSNKKEKNLAVLLYYFGFAFWIWVVVVAYYVT